MNCPKCNHQSEIHLKRGCYHADARQSNGFCDCTMTAAEIEIAALRADNARLRATLGEYANEDNWSVVDGYIQLWNANDYGPKQAAEALKDQAE